MIACRAAVVGERFAFAPVGARGVAVRRSGRGGPRGIAAQSEEILALVGAAAVHGAHDPVQLALVGVVRDENDLGEIMLVRAPVAVVVVEVDDERRGDHLR